jgi:hypothetical protein
LLPPFFQASLKLPSVADFREETQNNNVGLTNAISAFEAIVFLQKVQFAPAKPNVVVLINNWVRPSFTCHFSENH